MLQEAELSGVLIQKARTVASKSKKPSLTGLATTNGVVRLLVHLLYLHGLEPTDHTINNVSASRPSKIERSETVVCVGRFIQF